ncbi:MAG: archaemetzincin [Thermoanaerobaculia bacterium]|nr:archaemetzincin [Thermoanaerobaculia bacterium]
MGGIAIATAGAVDREAASWVESCLATALGIDTERLDPLPDPSYAYDEGRGQYSSTLVLHDALARRPAHAARLLVITEHDIFIPMLSFVYGQAQLDGPVAVLSLARLRQEFYGLPPNRPLFLVRARKEALHEIGHTFGLTHCNDPGCAMALSTNIEQLDAKGSDYCSGCATLLRDAARVACDGAELAVRSGGIR